MRSLEIDFTDELAELLEFSAQVAAAIRKNTPYHSTYTAKNPDHAQDVMWLAECLHNFDMLARTIREANLESIVFVCDMLIRMYERYAKKDSVQKAVFARYIQLDSACSIFHRIKRQAQECLALECTL